MKVEGKQTSTVAGCSWGHVAFRVRSPTTGLASETIPDPMSSEYRPRETPKGTKEPGHSSKSRLLHGMLKLGFSPGTTAWQQVVFA